MEWGSQVGERGPPAPGWVPGLKHQGAEPELKEQLGRTRKWVLIETPHRAQDTHHTEGSGWGEGDLASQQSMRRMDRCRPAWSAHEQVLMSCPGEDLSLSPARGVFCRVVLTGV